MEHSGYGNESNVVVRDTGGLLLLLEDDGGSGAGGRSAPAGAEEGIRSDGDNDVFRTVLSASVLDATAASCCADDRCTMLSRSTTGNGATCPRKDTSSLNDEEDTDRSSSSSPHARSTSTTTTAPSVGRLGRTGGSGEATNEELDPLSLSEVEVDPACLTMSLHSCGCRCGDGCDCGVVGCFKAEELR